MGQFKFQVFWYGSGRVVGPCVGRVVGPCVSSEPVSSPYKCAERDLSHEFMVDGGDRPQSSGKATDSMLSAGPRAE